MDLLHTISGAGLRAPGSEIEDVVQVHALICDMIFRLKLSMDQVEPAPDKHAPQVHSELRASVNCAVFSSRDSSKC